MDIFFFYNQERKIKLQKRTRVCVLAQAGRLVVFLDVECPGAAIMKPVVFEGSWKPPDNLLPELFSAKM